jgi:hypothetical protein
MLEYHKQANGIWPPAEISSTQKFNILVDEKASLPKSLNDLYIETWKLDDLQAYLAMNILHMMFIDKMTDSFRTYLFVFEYPMAYVRHRLELDV